MYSLWYFVYRGDFKQVAVGAKKWHRRQKEGTKNGCGIRKEEADSKGKDSRKEVGVYPPRRAKKENGACNRHPCCFC